MNIETVQKKFRAMDPLVADGLLGLGLALLACLQVWTFLHLRPVAPKPSGTDLGLRFDQGPRTPVWLTYLLVAGSFLPLMFRRKVPWLSFLLTGGASVIYSGMHSPPAFTTLGPMIALYTLAATSKRRGSSLFGLLIGIALLALPALAYGRQRTVIEAGGSFALLAAAALFGDAARNRRLYIAEVEQRAADAERAREEETRRRLDEERLRIARDVHDIVAHSLSIVTVQAAAADTLIDANPSGAHESVQHIRSTSKQALAELRSMLGVLRTGEAAPLQPAAELTRLESLLRQVRDAGLDVALDSDIVAERIPAHVSLSAYRIVQEALTNVVRHAHAKHATVSLHMEDDDLRIEITDDGIGVKAPSSHQGHGIEGMAERVAALGGHFEAGPVDSGFRVRAVLPTTREVQ